MKGDLKPQTADGAFTHWSSRLITVIDRSPERPTSAYCVASLHTIRFGERIRAMSLEAGLSPDEDVERTELDLRVPDRLPPRESQAGQLCHFTSSFWWDPQT